MTELITTAMRLSTTNKAVVRRLVLVVLCLHAGPAAASFLPSVTGGNIGINSASPRGRLDVDGGLYAGSIWVDGYIYGDGSRLSGISAGMSGSLTGARVPVASGAIALIDSAIYFTSGNTGIGSATPRSALDVAGKTSLREVVYVPPATVTVSDGSGIPSVASTLIKIVSSGGDVTVTADPQISITGAVDGQELIVVGTSDTDRVRFVNGRGLFLQGAVAFTMGNGAKLRLIYMAADNVWSEVSRVAAQ